MLITAGQLKAARSISGVTQEDVATETGLSVQTIKRMEIKGPETSSAANVHAVMSVLKTRGVTFLDDDGNGPGVRYKPAAKPV